MSNEFRKRGTGILCATALVAMAAPALGMPGLLQAVADQAPVSVDGVKPLVTAMCQEVTRLPANTRVEDLEGSLVFVLSQGDYSRAVLGSALNDLRTQCAGGPLLKTAITNVQLALLRRSGRGTAAIANGGSAGSGSGSYGAFSPLLGPGGGGSTNYSS